MTISRSNESGVFPEGFKGVWIPKEIWLDDRLDLTDKCILTEIAALDGEDGCFASNRHFAEYVGCSERRVSASVKRLAGLRLIFVDRSGRDRVIRTNLAIFAGIEEYDGNSCDPASQNIPATLADISTEHRKSCEPATQILRHSNTYSNTNNNTNNNTDNINNINNNSFDNISSSDNISINKSDNIRSKDTSVCSSEGEISGVINSYTRSEALREALHEFVKQRQKSRPFAAGELRLALGKLDSVAGTDEEKLRSVNSTVASGWAGFYPPKPERRQKQPSTGRISSYDIEQWEKYAESFVTKQLG